MKKSLLISFSILIFCSNIFAQSEDNITPETIKSIVKYSPVSLVNINFSSIQFAFEQRLNPRTSLQYQLGVGISKDNPAIRGMIEGRRYKVPLIYGRNTFQSLGFRYQYRNAGEQNYYYHQEVYTDVLLLTERRSNYGMYYSRGWHWIYQNGLSVELGLLIGAQYYRTALSGVPNDIDLDRLEKQPIIDLLPFRILERNLRGGLLPFGACVFKVGYAF